MRKLGQPPKAPKTASTPKSPKLQIIIGDNHIAKIRSQLTERLICELNERVLLIKDLKLRERALSLGMQLAFMIGIDEERSSAEEQKAVGT